MLKDDLLAFVNRAVPDPDHLSTYERNALVDYLMGDIIKVVKMSDLTDLTEEILPSWMAFVPRRKILKAAIAMSEATEETQNTTSSTRNHEAARRTQNTTNSTGRSHDMQQAGPSGSLMPLGNITARTRETTKPSRRNQLPVFTFIIPWASIPQDLLDELKEAHEREKPASTKTVKDFRETMAKKLMKEYNVYYENNPSAFQTPGVDIYRDIADEAILRFTYAFGESLNGNVYSNGRESLIKKLRELCENRGRPTAAERTARSYTVKAKGVLGVIAKEYAPPITQIMLTKQKLYRQKLQKKFEEGAHTWNLTNIEKMMTESYELQRQDIIDCRTAVLEDGDKNTDNEDDESPEANPDNPENRAMNVVVEQWPFLFQASHINMHNKRLSGLDLQERLVAFCSRKPLQYLSLFLTTSTKANNENLALKLNLESEIESVANSSLFVLCLRMLANHFKEEHNTFLQEVEKTMHPDDMAALGLPNHPVIISLGDFYFDKGFCIMVDRICIAKTSCALNAFIILLNAFFVFDLQYPSSMTLTFEFVERIILELAIEKSRVKDKRGKAVMVLTKSVKELGEDYYKFCEYMDVHLK